MKTRLRKWIMAPILAVVLAMPATAGVALLGTAGGVVVSAVTATPAFAERNVVYEYELQYQPRGYGYYGDSCDGYCWFEVYDVWRVVYEVLYDDNWNEISRTYLGSSYVGVETVAEWCA